MKPSSASSSSTARPSPCRVALLGCGAISELLYAPALQHLEVEGTAKLVTLFDKDPQRVAEFQKLFPEAASCQDESFLEKTPLDLAIIASPVHFHAAQSIRAIEAGLAVLCEKPMAVNTQEAERMIEAARKHQKILAVGLLRRFYANVQFTRELIQNKTLGSVKSFSIQEGGPFNWPARSDSFFRKKIAGGGVLLDIGVHVLDLVVHWFGEPEKITYADDAMGGLEANCQIDCSYAAGFEGSIRLSRDWETANCYVIEFERGTLKLRAGEADQVEIQLKDSTFSIKGPVKDRVSGASAPSYHQAFMVQLRNLIDAVQTAGRPAILGEEGIRSLRLIEKCYQARTLMPVPWLTSAEWKSAQILAAKEAA